MNKIKYTTTCGHLKTGLITSERKRVASLAKDVLARYEVRPDMLVVQGISGICLGTTLADMMDLPLTIVRKQEAETPHSTRIVEGPEGGGNEDWLEGKWTTLPFVHLNWVFVDDLIASGNTFRRVLRKMDSRYPANTLLGCMLYHEYTHSVISYTLHGDERVSMYTEMGREYDGKPRVRQPAPKPDIIPASKEYMGSPLLLEAVNRDSYEIELPKEWPEAPL